MLVQATNLNDPTETHKDDRRNKNGYPLVALRCIGIDTIFVAVFMSAFECSMDGIQCLTLARCKLPLAISCTEGICSSAENRRVHTSAATSFTIMWPIVSADGACRCNVNGTRPYE